MARTITQEERARLWLNYATEYNSRLFHRIASRFASLAEAYDAFAADAALSAALSERVQSRMAQARNAGFIDSLLDAMERKNIRFTYPGDGRYPALLTQISDPPGVLYYIGKLEPDPELSIAIVGSRHPTKYGKEVARRFGYELASAGVLVVSGMAEGVDAFAARGAHDAADVVCPTLAVLGCGVDVVYPQSNKALPRDHCARRGGIRVSARNARREVSFPDSQQNYERAGARHADR
ncbi:MAG: DNA-processing protein DprA [Eubacteriales bacterium]